MFQVTTAINKLLALSKRKRVIQGGTWAGKTYGIMAVLIDWCARHQHKKVTVVAETIPAVKEGALQQFMQIMQYTHRWIDARYNAVDMQYTFANGTKIQFKSFDSEGKAKAAGKRDVLFLNEANHIPFPIAHALIMRTEGNVWIDFNPDAEFWAHKEILPQEDSEFLLLKYTDNEGCPDSIIKELEYRRQQAATNDYWANWCRVYIDGEVGTLHNAIFETAKRINSIPIDAKLLGYGLDFGFSSDPAALVGAWRYNGEIILKELIYQTGLTNSDLCKLMRDKGIQDHDKIIADSAEPKSIEDIYRNGFRAIEPARKGPDSIKAGIDLIRQNKIIITEDSTNLFKEWHGYKWMKDKDGNTLPKPAPGNDHGIDAVRYLLLTALTQNKGEYYLI